MDQIVAAVKIQRLIRGNQTRKKLHQKQKAAIKIQHYFRHYRFIKTLNRRCRVREIRKAIHEGVSSRHIKSLEEELLQLKHAHSTRIQFILQNKKETSATRIQAWWKGKMLRRRLKRISQINVSPVDQNSIIGATEVDNIQPDGSNSRQDPQVSRRIAHQIALKIRQTHADFLTKDELIAKFRLLDEALNKYYTPNRETSDVLLDSCRSKRIETDRYLDKLSGIKHEFYTLFFLEL